MALLTIRNKATQQISEVYDTIRIRAMILCGTYELISGNLERPQTKIETAAIVPQQTANMPRPELYARGPRTRR